MNFGEKEYPNDLILDVISKSVNYFDFFEKLGTNHNNGRYLKLRKFIEDNKIDITHFSGQRNKIYHRLEELKIAILSSVSIRETLMKMGLAPLGGNYKVIKNAIEENNINISHFLGQASSSGKPGKIKDIEEYLVIDGPQITTSKLRVKLIEAGIFEHKCYNCNLTEWLTLPIPLELEHINGKNNDNRQENLTLLCPNCHALTPTYRGKNKGTYQN